MSCVSYNCRRLRQWICCLAFWLALAGTGHAQSVTPAPTSRVAATLTKLRIYAPHAKARIKTRSLVQAASASLWLQTGTFDWNTLSDQVLARAMDDAIRSIPNAVTVPLSVNAASAMEFDNRRPLFDAISALPIERKSDLKITQSAVIGATSKYSEDDPRTSLSQSTDQAMAAYFALKASPAFNLDFRAEHGETATAIAGQNSKGARDVASAKISGSVDLWHFKLAPAVSVETEAQRHLNGSAKGEGSDKVSIEVAPRFSRPFDLSYGQKLEPFIMAKGRKEVGTTVQGTALEPSTSRSVGGGVTLTQPDTFSLSVTTEMERYTETSPPELKSKLQLNIPLK